MPNLPRDAETKLVQEHFAVIYTPRRSRNRFPENCVEVMASAEEAVESADPDNGRHPAKVLGPSRSSEGFRLYYLVHWL